LMRAVEEIVTRCGGEAWASSNNAALTPSPQ